MAAKASKTPDIEAVANDLARAHRRDDRATVAIYQARAQDEVRLVEVTGSVGTTNDVLPFRMGARPDLGVPFASVVVLLSPDEWQSVEQGKLSLPSGWGEPADLRKIA